MYSVYEIKQGDTIESIAQNLNITPEVISSINGLSITSPLTQGQYIVVPQTDSPFNKYIVKQGDTIYQIAQNNNINPSQLAKLNGLYETAYIYPNQEIFLPKPNISFYITNEGDTLNQVINTLNTTANNLARENNTIYLVPDQLIVSSK